MRPRRRYACVVEQRCALSVIARVCEVCVCVYAWVCFVSVLSAHLWVLQTLSLCKVLFQKLNCTVVVFHFSIHACKVKQVIGTLQLKMSHSSHIMHIILLGLWTARTLVAQVCPHPALFELREPCQECTNKGSCVKAHTLLQWNKMHCNAFFACVQQVAKCNLKRRGKHASRACLVHKGAAFIGYFGYPTFVKASQLRRNWNWCVATCMRICFNSN